MATCLAHAEASDKTWQIIGQLYTMTHLVAGAAGYVTAGAGLNYTSLAALFPATASSLLGEVSDGRTARAPFLGPPAQPSRLLWAACRPRSTGFNTSVCAAPCVRPQMYPRQDNLTLQLAPQGVVTAAEPSSFAGAASTLGVNYLALSANLTNVRAPSHTRSAEGGSGSDLTRACHVADARRRRRFKSCSTTS